MEEVKLGYSSVSAPVKVGETVRRQIGPWTPTIHALLDYLQRQGFAHAPVAHGIDEKGREIISFIPGKAAVRPWPNVLLGTDGIMQAARILRQYHDAVQGFMPSQNAIWRVGQRVLKPGQIIRHGDLGPWNTIWQNDTLIALIDWDFAQPGERIEDLAQMAYYFVPLRGEEGWVEAGFTQRPDMAQRLRALVESYDGGYSLEQVISALEALLEEDRVTTLEYGKQGLEPWVSFVKRGDIASSLQNSAWLQDIKHELI